MDQIRPGFLGVVCGDQLVHLLELHVRGDDHDVAWRWDLPGAGWGVHPVLFILHITGATLICIYGVEESQILVDELNERLTRMVYLWDIDDRASRIMKIIMEYVGCCGATGGDDFIFSYKPIPAECRDPRTGSEWQYGCEQGLAFWLEPWTGTLAGMSVGLSVCDILLIALTMKSRAKISEIKEDY